MVVMFLGGAGIGFNDFEGRFARSRGSFSIHRGGCPAFQMVFRGLPGGRAGGGLRGYGIQRQASGVRRLGLWDWRGFRPRNGGAFPLHSARELAPELAEAVTDDARSAS